MGPGKHHITPWWLWLAAAALVALAFSMTIRWLVVTWLGSPYYSHGFLIPAVSVAVAVLLDRQCSDIPGHARMDQRAFWLGASWVALSIAAHLMALYYQRHVSSALALVSAVSGLVLTLGGAQVLKRQAFPLAFLLLMIPLPYLEQSTPHLSRLVASAVAAIAKVGGMDLLVSGARIELAGTALVIGAPCSGVNSLAALVTLAVLYAYLTRCSTAARLAIVLLAVPIALAANLVRVLLILVLAQFWSVDLALGFFHDWSSPVLFLMALSALLTIGRGLGCQGNRFDTSG